MILTTHVPGLAELLPQEGVRLVEKNDDGQPLINEGSDEVYQRITESLGVLPDNRVRLLIYVEGNNDVNFFGHLSTLIRTEDNSIPDLLGDHRVAFVPTGGGNLRHWVNRQYLSGFGLCEVHIYDRDDPDNPPYAEMVDEVNARDDKSVAFLTTKREMENYLHPDAITAVFNVAIGVDENCDVPYLVAEAVHNADADSCDWADLTVKKQEKKKSLRKKRLNNEVAASMTVEMLSESDPDDEIKGWLMEIRDRLT